jgi:sugar lactone lactonase YvrE
MATFSVAVSGRAPISYQWQFNGTNLPNNIITTLMGKGVGIGPGGAGYFGDGGPATNALLNNPEGVAVDGRGNVFIGDTFNHRIRKVGANGIVTTVAGGGTNSYGGPSGYSGDGGPATNAELNSPAGVALDSTGNLFIADSRNNRIRKVGTNGIITTIAGGALNMYGESWGFAGDGGPATNAQMDSPLSVAVDSAGNLFIADSNNNRIREVKAADGRIITVAGNGTYGYSGDGGAAANAELNRPTGVAVDGTGNLFIVDNGNNRLRTMGTNGLITTVAGKGTGGGTGGIGDGGAATNASLSSPMGVAVDSAGNLFIVDAENGRIREVDTNGIITTVAGNGFWKYSGDGGAATNASFWFYNNDYDSGVAVDSVGNLFIADTYNDCIREVGFGGYPTLTLNDTTASDIGNYRVIISNSSGGITSSVAFLSVISPPVVCGLANNVSGGLTLCLVTTTNVSSRIYAATNLTPPVVWQPIYTNLNGGAWQFTDTNTGGILAKYYRLSTP